VVRVGSADPEAKKEQDGLSSSEQGLRATFPILADGVTVARQILVLFVQVRILVGQLFLVAANAGGRSARLGSRPLGDPLS
jgi:hypothetical protein